MHPLYAFGTAIADPTVLWGVHWCIEGDAAAKHVACRLIGDLRGHVSEIQPEHKMLYHVAAAVAGNLITGLLSISCSMWTIWAFARPCNVPMATSDCQRQ